jgi:hypothetical protein
MTLLSLNLPVIGQQSATEDQKVRDALAAIQTGVNGNLDETNLPNLTAAFTTYKAITPTFRAVLNAAAAAGTYGLGSDTIVNTGFTTVIPMQHAIYLDPSFYNANARTTQYRMRTLIVTNATAPAVNFTPVMHQVTSIGGAATPVAQTSSAVAGATATVTAPTAQSLSVADSGAFTAPAASAYIFGVSTSGALAANASVVIVAQLLMRQL